MTQLVIHSHGPSFPTLGDANTVWSDKNICSDCCKRCKNKSLPNSERSTLSAANKSRLSMRNSGNLVYILYPTLFVKMLQSYMFASKTFLKRLDSSLFSINPGTNSSTKLKWWLATVWKCFAVLIILMHNLNNLAACCIRILSPPQYMSKIWGASFTLNHVLILE